ncbi:MAG: VOC family protein [Acidobacteriaceae bacterium]|nr:VOC family protein [Acidobacteriaceae bacterium]
MSHKLIAPARSVLCRVVLLPLLASLTLFASAQTAPTAASAPAATTAPQLLTMNGIAHIAIRVKDIAASVAFYHKLGFEQAFVNTAKDGSVSQAFLKINDKQFIELYPVTANDPQVGFLHLCFEGADLNALHDAYEAEGLAPIAVRKAAAGNLLFTIKGPEQPAFPQNIEYTQYMPDSRHSKDAGLHLGADRVADRMTIVSLAMQNPASARAFYLAKLGFTVDPANLARLTLPGTSSQQVEFVSADVLGLRSSITLIAPSLNKAVAQLTRQQIDFHRVSSSVKDAKGKVQPEIIIVQDPDNNSIRIVAQ